MQRTIVIACIVTPVVSSLFVFIRVWTRRFITHSIGWEDYAAFITWLLCIVYSVLVGLATNYGFGWHTADISPDLYIMYNKWIFISGIVYLIALFGYKFTILLLYLRLFGVDQKFRYATWIVMLFVFGYLFGNLLTQLFGCTPLDKYWMSSTPGHCVVIVKAAFAYGSMNFISDLFIIALPLPMVWRLQLSRKGKLGVTLVFLSGAIAFVVAAVRYGLLVRAVYVSDKLWYAGKEILWMILEINTGLICSCTLVIKPFFNHFATNGLFKFTFGGLMSSPTNNVPPRRRRDGGPFGQRNDLGNDEIEMEDFHTEPLEVVEAV